jgi:hypothetical protein
VAKSRVERYKETREVWDHTNLAVNIVAKQPKRVVEAVSNTR